MMKKTWLRVPFLTASAGAGAIAGVAWREFPCMVRIIDRRDSLASARGQHSVS